MAELVIKIDDETYKETINRTENDTLSLGIKLIEAVQNGTLLPKGHGRLIDENDVMKIYNKDDRAWCIKEFVPTIIKADKEYEAEVITRGNCMICGKELTEGLFFCKECENKASEREK